MSESNTTHSDDPLTARDEKTEGTRARDRAMPMCPMASMCKGFAGKPPSRVFLMIPGVVLILVGVLILLQPKVLIWLIAGVSILLGVLFLLMVNFIRKVGNQLRGAHG